MWLLRKSSFLTREVAAAEGTRLCDAAGRKSLSPGVIVCQMTCTRWRENGAIAIARVKRKCRTSTERGLIGDDVHRRSWEDVILTVDAYIYLNAPRRMHTLYDESPVCLVVLCVAPGRSCACSGTSALARLGNLVVLGSGPTLLGQHLRLS